jgi:hypothetical protein
VSSASFFDLLEQSLEVLRHEIPDAHDEFVRTLGCRLVSIETDGERRIVSFSGSGMRTHGAGGRADVEIAFGRATVLDLVDGHLSLPHAVMTGRIELRGGVDSIGRFDRALQSYVSGAVRCPSMPRLLSRFRRNEGGGGPDG